MKLISHLIQRSIGSIPKLSTINLKSLVVYRFSCTYNPADQNDPIWTLIDRFLQDYPGSSCYDTYDPENENCPRDGFPSAPCQGDCKFTQN